MKEFFYSERILKKWQCKDIIQWFEDHESKQMQGVVNTREVITSVKDSTDIYMHMEENNLVNHYIREPLSDAFFKYQNKYPILGDISDWGIEHGYNLQRYKPDGGYKELHFESAHPKVCHRLFAWMIYLNTDWFGGTRFPYLNKTFAAKAGKLLIWPASFTHTHASQITKRTKYIATGWASFI